MIRRLWIVVALAAAGCGTGGAWSKDGFSQETYGWKASYPPGATALLGADWRVDNWEQRTAVSPGGASSTSFGEKTGPGFTIDYDDDGNGDGKVDENESGRKFLYDLKLAHVSDDGMIWIKTRTLSEGDVRKSLELLTESTAGRVHVGPMSGCERTFKDDGCLTTQWPGLCAAIGAPPL